MVWGSRRSREKIQRMQEKRNKYEAKKAIEKAKAEEREEYLRTKRDMREAKREIREYKYGGYKRAGKRLAVGVGKTGVSIGKGAVTIHREIGKEFANRPKYKIPVKKRRSPSRGTRGKQVIVIKHEYAKTKKKRKKKKPAQTYTSGWGI